MLGSSLLLLVLVLSGMKLLPGGVSSSVDMDDLEALAPGPGCDTEAALTRFCINSGVAELSGVDEALRSAAAEGYELAVNEALGTA